MKTNLKMCCLILFTLACSCKEFPDTPSGQATVYLTAAASKPYLVPGVIKNYQAIKETRMLHVPVYVSKAGLGDQSSYSLNITADEAAAQQIIGDGDVSMQNAIIAPAETYTIPATALIDHNTSSFDVVFDGNKLSPYTGKKLLLAVSIASTSAVEISEDLHTLYLLVDVDLVLVGARTEVTNTYLKNSGAPFIASARSQTDTRRGVLADWITNPPVKNFENGTYGGFDDYAGGGFMSMERYSSPAIPNGKIYQTVKLPAARYDLEVQFLDFSIKDQAYLAAAAGNTLPDVENIQATLAHVTFDTPKLSFEVSSEQEVSIGVVANLIQDFQNFRINKFRLYQYKNIFDEE